MQEAQDRIKEGNRSIGEFIDISDFKIDPDSGRFLVCRNCPITGWYSLDELKYHTDWNWIMPVVKKIAGLPLLDFPKKKPIMNALLSVDIEELWLAIVDFLKWFNQQPR